MEVGCVPRISMGLLIIEVFFSKMGVTIYRRHLSIYRCNTDISATYRRYCPIFFDFSLNRLSMPDIVSESTAIRNIDDISRHSKPRMSTLTFTFTKSNRKIITEN